MNEPEATPPTPPILEEAVPAPATAPQPRWRWAVHLALLMFYVLGIGLLGSLFGNRAETGGAALPKDVNGVLWLCATELGLFGAVFAVAWLFSRASAEQLMLKWRGGVKPVLWGMLHSVLLRVGIAIAVLIIVLPFMMIKGSGEGSEKELEKLRPKVEAVIDPKALEDPVYLMMTLTLVSFLVAGLREELWRAGILAGLAGLAPGVFGTRRGQYLAVVVAAIIFGIGHLPQGLGGVAMTGLLGIGLGVIMVAHKSIWEAVLAHGFFNATTFVFLYVIIKFMPGALKAFGIS